MQACNRVVLVAHNNSITRAAHQSRVRPRASGRYWKTLSCLKPLLPSDQSTPQTTICCFCPRLLPLPTKISKSAQATKMLRRQLGANSVSMRSTIRARQACHLLVALITLNLLLTTIRKTRPHEMPIQARAELRMICPRMWAVWAPRAGNSLWWMARLSNRCLWDRLHRIWTAVLVVANSLQVLGLVSRRLQMLPARCCPFTTPDARTRESSATSKSNSRFLNSTQSTSSNSRLLENKSKRPRTTQICCHPCATKKLQTALMWARTTTSS